MSSLEGGTYNLNNIPPSPSKKTKKQSVTFDEQIKQINSIHLKEITSEPPTVVDIKPQFFTFTSPQKKTPKKQKESKELKKNNTFSDEDKVDSLDQKSSLKMAVEMDDDNLLRPVLKPSVLPKRTTPKKEGKSTYSRRNPPVKTGKSELRFNPLEFKHFGPKKEKFEKTKKVTEGNANNVVDIDKPTQIVLEEQTKCEPVGSTDLYKTEVDGSKEYLVLEDDDGLKRKTTSKTYYCYEEKNNQITLEQHDLDILKNNDMINDTIIDFYSKWIENEEVPTEYKGKCLFMSVLFLTKLQGYFSDLEKALQKEAKENNEHFDDQKLFNEFFLKYKKIRHWLGDADIFKYKFIFLPLHTSSHFSLIVLCFNGVEGFESLVMTEDPQKVDVMKEAPCCLIIDSLGRKFIPDRLKIIIQLFVTAEFKVCKKEIKNISEDMKEYSINCIQQTNFVDCGCYVLYFIRKMACSPSRRLYDLKPIFVQKEAENERQRICEIVEKLEKKDM
ncbi:hypothetical protein EIN_074100 [Entamoeba invadens IP1]|uniref:Ubiquitin-like protease family profile domain-containing protein n=1 Tax=Entamoeba invadens IP1 TaxID=370355 RepID=A0A0A1UBP5_ENTIV|nr:hypothetical protein EIN_074100 [Entamoeba invadens IP1]ELP92577.1 hypothetical protein EIN_074100 [Entamoeba invadens IP1]|eukprot:XP_004259348.1 hypothetical protein EIN_074100 [Entamoeba invadens IP1]